MISVNFNDTAVNNTTKSVDYRCIITTISKSEAIQLLQNIDLTEKSEAL